MTSLSSENSRLSSSSSSVSANDNVKISQNILVKDQSKNEINNKNILLLNRTIIAPGYALKNSDLLRIAPTKSGIPSKTRSSKLSESKISADPCFSSEINCKSDRIHLTEQLRKYEKNTASKDIIKKETPLLQIFDGNVVISQELSIEEVQNLLFQINSKLQNQTSVNSTDFPNVTFSKEETSDVEIILEDKITSDKGNQFFQTGITNVFDSSSEPGIEDRFELNNLKANLVPINGKITNDLDQPSTSAETNLLLSFKKSDNRNLECSEFEHDYSAVNKKTVAGDNGNQKIKGSLDDTEVMQIELLETGIELVKRSICDLSHE
ncbi:hypothetical protein Phum_PHUM466510 [Pediculus humanus corporis]|uniref:Uncharacterized protein n=1 Tax=Pediculus humanus subsp. corporis TaxID=121224 RepID=E0VVP9_PEDHC|nr:uncharacterized protein Phum_PHUM466510 [Pediculus humanus corporis]EEB17455.1 hypothetical protein Phum_PHUM466510 [Pediculus humanus corporis]